MIDGQLVIDGDGHYVETPDVWDRYLDPGYGDRLFFETRHGGAAPAAGEQARMGMVDGDIAADAVVQRLVVDGVEFFFTRPGMPFSVGDTMTPRGIAEGVRRNRRFEDSAAGGFFGPDRLAVHDAEGIDAAVLFPSMGLFFASIADPDLAAAACRAINRFCADYCSAAPHELYGVAALPSQHPEAAAAELERCVDEYGFVGGFLLPNPTKAEHRTVGDAAFERLWSVAEDLDVAVCMHGSSNSEPPTAGADRAQGFLLMHAITHPFEQMLAFGSLFQARVFDRHPRLRMGFMESNAGWAPFWLDRLDEHCEVMGWMFDPPIDRLPSEIFAEQCSIGCETDEHMVPYVQDRLGDDVVVWASDYPHFDCSVPGLVSPLFERDDLDDRRRDGILRRSSLRLFNLDEGAIRAAVERRRGGVGAPARSAG